MIIYNQICKILCYQIIIKIKKIIKCKNTIMILNKTKIKNKTNKNQIYFKIIQIINKNLI
jgi:hypothetical protein